MVYLARGAAVDVEGYAEILERFLDDAVIAVYHVLHSNALFLCADCHWHAVLVRTSDEHHFPTLQAEIAHINVCRHVYASQVAYMHGTIGVWQSCCHCCSLEFIFFHCNVFFYSVTKLQKRADIHSVSRS